ncbi:MAG: lipocalin family protein [Alphaproteobacteria bacterium]|jgi:apolipoprotein D and lipocalin family protein|nr:lipocalin family protein [Alphaproteobacteria bacterium]
MLALRWKQIQKASFLASKKFLLLPFALLSLAACSNFEKGPVGNPHVPEPAKAIELNRYLGRWYEIARYEAGFQKGCEYVTADYSLRPDGKIKVVNACRRGGPDAPRDSVEGHAYVVDGSQNTKLRVTFFWPFYGNYWVLDHGDAYDWAIVGEPSGHYLWFLTRDPHPSDETIQRLKDRAAQMGYNLKLLRMTQQ